MVNYKNIGIVGSILIISVIATITLYPKDYRKILADNPSATYVLMEFDKDCWKINGYYNQSCTKLEILTRGATDYLRWHYDTTKFTLYSGQYIGAEEYWLVYLNSTKLTAKTASTVLYFENGTDSIIVIKETPYYLKTKYKGTLVQKSVITSHSAYYNFPEYYEIYWIPVDSSQYKMVWNTRKLTLLPGNPDGYFGSEYTELTFKYNIKVTWANSMDKFDHGYLDKSARQLYIYFKSAVGTQILDVKTFDPIATLYLNGTSADRYYETDHYANITATCDSASTTCLSMDYPGLGNNFQCGTGNTKYYFSAIGSQNQFNNSQSVYNLSFAGVGQNKTWINLDKRVTVVGSHINLTGYPNGGNYPQNVIFNTGNDSINDTMIVGNLTGDVAIVNWMSDGNKTKNETFTVPGSILENIKVFGNSTIKSANMMLNGLGSSYESKINSTWNPFSDTYNPGVHDQYFAIAKLSTIYNTQLNLTGNKSTQLEQQYGAGADGYTPKIGDTAQFCVGQSFNFSDVKTISSITVYLSNGSARIGDMINISIKMNTITNTTILAKKSITVDSTTLGAYPNFNPVSFDFDSYFTPNINTVYLFVLTVVPSPDVVYVRIDTSGSFSNSTDNYPNGTYKWYNGYPDNNCNAYYAGGSSTNDLKFQINSYPNNLYFDLNRDGINEWSLPNAEFRGTDAYLSRLSDLSTTKNLIFTENQNQTFYIKLPKTANIENAQMTLSAQNITKYNITIDTSLGYVLGIFETDKYMYILSTGKYTQFNKTTFDKISTNSMDIAIFMGGTWNGTHIFLGNKTSAYLFYIDIYDNEDLTIANKVGAINISTQCNQIGTTVVPSVAYESPNILWVLCSNFGNYGDDNIFKVYTDGSNSTGFTVAPNGTSGRTMAEGLAFDGLYLWILNNYGDFEHGSDGQVASKINQITGMADGKCDDTNNCILERITDVFKSDLNYDPSGIGFVNGDMLIGSYWTQNRYAKYTYPAFNPYLDVGNDGDLDWYLAGELNSTNVNITNDLIQQLATCIPDANNTCTIPLVLHSDTLGQMQISGININYNNISSIILNKNWLQNYIDNTCIETTCQIPFRTYSDTAGILQLNSHIVYEDQIYNLEVDTGDDNQVDYSLPGFFNTSSGSKNINLNITAMQNYLKDCSFDSLRDCNIPIKFTSTRAGKLQIANFSVNYTFNPIEINNTAVKATLSASTTNSTNVSMTFYSNQSGLLQASQINVTFYGSKNYTVTASCNGVTDSQQLKVVFSNFSVAYPKYIYYFEMILTNSTQYNITPYGQSSSKPIWNVSSKAYDKPMNISARLNQSINACFKINFTNAATPYDGVQISTTPYNYINNMPVGGNYSLWSYGNSYGCNYTIVGRRIDPVFILDSQCTECL